MMDGNKIKKWKMKEGNEVMKDRRNEIKTMKDGNKGKRWKKWKKGTG